MSERMKRGAIFGGLLLGSAALVPGLAVAAGSGQAATPPAQTQSQPAPSTQQKAMAPNQTTGTDKPASSRETMKDERREVEAVQQALNQQGSNLKVDGKLGSKTREALKEFQQKNGLKPTGRLDKATESALKVT
jgi:peptidoglycan hydrolase-like protein with peptidoglycan-binding domain